MGAQRNERPGPRIHYPYGNGGGETSAGRGWHGLRERPLSPPLLNTVLPGLSRLPNGSIVVNLGCGDGNFELHAPLPADRPYRFLSLDQSPKAVEILDSELAARNGNDSTFKDRVGVADITAPGLLDGINVAAVVSSRVLHALSPEDHTAVLQTVADALPEGGRFYWSALADTDWKRRELEALGQYDPNGMNDCYGVMKLDQIGRTEPWLVHFFSREYIEQLAAKHGFIVEGIEEFTEPTSFDHLAQDTDPAHNNVNYYFAVFRKQEAESSTPPSARWARTN